MKLPFQIDLNDKVVVITGAGGLICSAFAEAMAMCVEQKLLYLT